MPQRIEAETTLGLRGRVAATQRYPAVRDFVQGDRQQQGWRQHHEKLNRIEILHSVIIRGALGDGLVQVREMARRRPTPVAAVAARRQLDR